MRARQKDIQCAKRLAVRRIPVIRLPPKHRLKTQHDGEKVRRHTALLQHYVATAAMVAAGRKAAVAIALSRPRCRKQLNLEGHQKRWRIPRPNDTPVPWLEILSFMTIAYTSVRLDRK